MENKTFRVKDIFDRERLDVVISKELGISRAQAQRLIKAKNADVGGKSVKPGFKVKKGGKITVKIPLPAEIKVLPENIFVEILYEDNDIIVVNKPAGMVVHPSGKRISGTLVNALLFHCRNLSGIGGFLRPGIVHRLDKDTSGVLVVAKNDKAHQKLSEQFKERKVFKKYIAVVCGHLIDKAGSINVPIGRSLRDRKKIGIFSRNTKEAETNYKVIKEYKNASLVEVTIKTGRTHQIRVHFNYLKHPVFGDIVYGKKDGLINRQALHCLKLGFYHPSSDKYMEFESRIPVDIKRLIQNLETE